MTPGKQTQLTEFTVWLIAGLLAVAVAGIHADTAGSATAHKLTWYPAFGLGRMLNQEIPPDSRANIKRQLKAEWYGGFEVHVYGRPGTNRRVNNCEGFFAALEEHMVTVKEYELYYYSYLGLQCHIARAILEGTGAKQSYLTGFTFDETIIDLFPPNLANILLTKAKERILSDKTMTNWRKAGQMESIEVENEHTAHVKSRIGGLQDIFLIAKGDFNNDGFEDIIVMIKNTVVGGSHKSSGLFLLTRKSADPMFELVKEYKAR